MARGTGSCEIGTTALASPRGRVSVTFEAAATIAAVELFSHALVGGHDWTTRTDGAKQRLRKQLVGMLPEGYAFGELRDAVGAAIRNNSSHEGDTVRFVVEDCGGFVTTLEGQMDRTRFELAEKTSVAIVRTAPDGSRHELQTYEPHDGDYEALAWLADHATEAVLLTDDVARHGAYEEAVRVRDVRYSELQRAEAAWEAACHVATALAD